MYQPESSAPGFSAIQNHIDTLTCFINSPETQSASQQDARGYICQSMEIYLITGQGTSVNNGPFTGGKS